MSMKKVKAVHNEGAVLFCWLSGDGSLFSKRNGGSTIAHAENYTITPIEFFPGEKVDVVTKLGGCHRGCTFMAESQKAWFVEGPHADPHCYYKATVSLRPHVETYSVTVELTMEEMKARTQQRTLTASVEQEPVCKLDAACAKKLEELTGESK